jgi:hypothetical protein
MIIFNDSDINLIQDEIKNKTEFLIKKQLIQQHISNISPEKFAYEIEIKLYENDLSWESSMYSSYKIRHFPFDSWIEKINDIVKDNKIDINFFLQYRQGLYEIDNITNARYRLDLSNNVLTRSIKSKLLKKFSSKLDEKFRSNMLLKMNMNLDVSIEYEDIIKISDIKYLKINDMQSVQGYMRFSFKLNEWKVDISAIFNIDPEKWKQKNDDFYNFHKNNKNKTFKEIITDLKDLNADDYTIEFEYLRKEFDTNIFYKDLKVLLEKTNTENNFKNYIISKGVNDSSNRLYQLIVDVLLSSCVDKSKKNKDACQIMINKYQLWHKNNSLNFSTMLNNPINLNIFNMNFFIINMKDYYITPKLDGERIVMIFKNDKIEFLFANKYYSLNSSQLIQTLLNDKIYLFECEYCEKNNIKYIFIFNQIEYNKTFQTIYENTLISSNMIKLYNEFNKEFPEYFLSLNEFREISNMSKEELLTTFNLIYKDEYNIRLLNNNRLSIGIDGLIFTYKKSTYDKKTIFKYKRPELSTVDVLVKQYKNEDVYFLFCSILGSVLMALPFNVLEILKDCFNINKIEPNNIYPMPLILGFYKMSLMLNEDCGIDLSKINNTICEFSIIPSYDNKVLTGLKYKFIRIREDKTSSYSMGKSNYGNFYHVCCDAITEVLSPIYPEKLIDGSYEKISDFELTYFKNINKLILSNIPMKKINTSILCINCGTGEEYDLLIKNYTNIIGIDNNLLHLIKYQKRILLNQEQLTDIKLFLINDDINNPVQMDEMLTDKLFDIILINKTKLIDAHIIKKYLNQYGFLVCYVKESLSDMQKLFNKKIFNIEQKQITDDNYYKKIKSFYEKKCGPTEDIDTNYNYYLINLIQ